MTVRSVGAVSILTGAPETGIVDVIAVAFGLRPFDPTAWESDPLRRWRSERRSSP
jgi:hypothetical protein